MAVRKYIVIILVFSATQAFPQKQFQFTQYQQTALLFNPAFSGIEDFVDLKLGYRNRWAGLENSPTTAFFMTNLAFRISAGSKYKRRGIRLVEPEAYHRLETSEEFQWRKAHRQGFGAWIQQNTNTDVSEIGGFLSYAYHLPISDYIVWSVGASAGVINARLNADNLTVSDPDNDPTYQNYLRDGGASTDAIINLGTVVYSRDWYIGYAAKQAVVSNISNVNNFGSESNSIIHNFMVGITYKPKYGFLVMPGVMVEYNTSAPLSYLINIRVKYEDAIWGGLGYRIDDAVNLSFGLYLTPMIAFNYTFEYSLSELSGLNSSTHEIILAVKLNNKNFSRAYMW